MLRVSKKLENLLLSGVVVFTIIPLSGCVNSDKESSKVYSAGTHNIVRVDRTFDMFWGKDGLYGLKAPEGYKIVDYDYDKVTGFQFDDYLLVNDEEIITSDSNKVGEPTKSYKIEDSKVLKPGEHVITSINRSYNPFFGKGDTKFRLSAPDGYRVLDYDYDYSALGDDNSRVCFDFENITYVNTCDVEVDDINKFGKVKATESIYDIDEDNKCDAYQDIVVVINRDLDLLFGKNETKQLLGVPGYKIIDYDYDKSDSLSFETIVYQNTVPVTIDNDNDFGIPVEDVVIDNHDDSIYRSGEHVIVDIKRNLSFFLGYDGSKEVSMPDGYAFLDYDYDKNSSFEFETYVYVNDKDVKVQNDDEFGKVLKK